MKVLIFGSQGYLGQQFLELYPDAVATDADIADPSQVATALDTHTPDVVINAAGKTGRPNIDWCEDNREETVRANVTGPLVLLDECAKRNVYWVHLSSGCIYQGDNEGRGFTEADAPNFTGSFYSRTKALCDQLLKEFEEQILILRLRMPFDGTDNPRSLLNKLRQYPRVLDVQNSITYLPEFMSAAKQLIETKETGLFNVTNPGTVSPYQMMEMYKEIVDPSHTFDRLLQDSASEVTKVARSNCVLSSEKLMQKGVQLSPIKDVVTLCLQQMRDQSVHPVTV